VLSVNKARNEANLVQETVMSSQLFVLYQSEYLDLLAQTTNHKLTFHLIQYNHRI